MPSGAHKHKAEEKGGCMHGKDKASCKDCASICMHGRAKHACNICSDVMCECFVIEHHPYLPCLPGHGPSWLWCQSAGIKAAKEGDPPTSSGTEGVGGGGAEGEGGTGTQGGAEVLRSLDSSGFFREVEEAPGRGCRKKMWPRLHAQQLRQERGYGYHVLEYRGVRFSGFLLHGLPHGMCSVRWPDGRCVARAVQLPSVASSCVRCLG